MDRQQLCRMVKTKGDLQLRWDEGYKIQGYGVYLCKQGTCITDFLNKKKFKKKYLQYLTDECLEKLNSQTIRGEAK